MLDVFFCFLVNFTNTPAKTKECPSKKGHFEKEKLVFQPLFFRVDILVFAGNRYLFAKRATSAWIESPLVTYVSFANSSLLALDFNGSLKYPWRKRVAPVGRIFLTDLPVSVLVVLHSKDHVTKKAGLLNHEDKP